MTAFVTGYRARARELYVAEDAHDHGSAAATFLALFDDGVTLHARWLGNHTALVIRDQAIVWQTRPHSLRNLLVEAGHDLAGAEVPSIVTRMVSTDPQMLEDVPDRAAFTDRRAGDRLVLGGHELHDQLTPDELIGLTAGTPPALAAQALLERVVTRSDPFGFVVGVCDLAT
ncbi:MAG: hypothetical protein H0T79_07435 [Deltaproteobacteria bacterium]|nr:hypothetical protein [Deltaproteobacteria bacterium]